MPSALARLRELPPELRNAGIAAAALAVSLLLPWYQQSYVPEGSREFVQRNVSAFGVFSFVEAAVLLVAAAVLFLVWARSEKKGFHLPGGDGTAIALAGGWALLLLVWRLFDKPDAPDRDEQLRHPVGHVRGAGRGRRAAGRRPARARRAPARAAEPGRRRGGAAASHGRRGAAPTRPRSPRCSASGRTGPASRRRRRAERRGRRRRETRRRPIGLKTMRRRPAGSRTATTPRPSGSKATPPTRRIEGAETQDRRRGDRLF